MPRPRVATVGLWLVAYAASFLLLGVVGAVATLAHGTSLARSLAILPRLWMFTAGDPLGWALALVPLGAFAVGWSLVRVGRGRGPRALLGALLWRVAVPGLVLWGAWQTLQWRRTERPVAWQHDPASENQTGRAGSLFAQDGKQRGVHLEAGRRASDAVFAPLLRDNVEWIALGPFGWQENVHSTQVRLGRDGPGRAGADSNLVRLVTQAHARGMRVMLKPQIWLGGRGGAWLGDIDPGSDADWDAWFASYRSFILHYAELAERAGVEILCVGTELQRAVQERPADWRSLIAAIRTVYHGRLTYAANWRAELDAVQFWDALDFIGVQAYYPLARHASPSVAEMVTAWAPICRALAKTSAQYGKPVLFTEIGWKSTPDGAVRPWEWTERPGNLLARVSTRAQADAYEAFFRACWDQPWLAGAYIWKWYGDHPHAGGPRSIDFTPQNKPAEAVLARGYHRVVPR